MHLNLVLLNDGYSSAELEGFDGSPGFEGLGNLSTSTADCDDDDDDDDDGDDVLGVGRRMGTPKPFMTNRGRGTDGRSGGEGRDAAPCTGSISLRKKSSSLRCAVVQVGNGAVLIVGVATLVVNGAAVDGTTPLLSCDAGPILVSSRHDMVV